MPVDYWFRESERTDLPHDLEDDHHDVGVLGPQERAVGGGVSDLRIVLLGKSVSENSRVGNFLLGRASFDSEVPPDVVERVRGRLKDRHVMVINSPQLLQTNISDHQITQTVRECVNLSDPGPHVFILVLQYNDFTEEEMRRVKYVLEQFSEEAIKRTIVVMTIVCSVIIITSEIQQLIKECGGGSLQLDERKPEWQSEIFKRVDKILEENKKECLTCVRYEDVEGTSVAAEQKQKENEERLYHKDDGKPKDSDKGMSTNVSGNQKLNLVLCGSDATLTVSVSKHLQGKTISSSHQQLNSEECVRRHVELHGHQISLMELPALSRLSEEEVMRQTLRCVSLCHPGVHVFLLIVPAGPLTDEDKAEIDKIKTIFDSREHFILLFTSDLSVEGPVKDLVKSSTESQKLISRCVGQYRVIGLNEPENSKQIPELLEYIENMKTEPYSLQMYVKAQENRVRRELEERLSLMENKVKELKQRNQSEVSKRLHDIPAVSLSSRRIVLLGRSGVGKNQQN
ncbi:hypothetical protein ABG768_020414 [Culter alburnus]|uniref:AIG1-type G domain-containing protein n=1 Tax=Culter alburnus TaxID=194366 RepID=A0AAW2B0J6_CULAL